MMLRNLLPVLCLAGAAGLGGCYGSGSETRVPTSLENLGGSGQSAPVGQPLDSPLRVRVVDQEGDPVSGIRVIWEAVTGGGRPQARTSETTQDGNAQMIYIVGSTPGPQTARAVVTGLDGSPQLFTATAVQGGGGGGGGGGGESPTE